MLGNASGACSGSLSPFGKGSGAGWGLAHIAFSSSALCLWDPTLRIPVPKAERP